MIGKIMIGKSFRGCLLYCLNNKRVDLNNLITKDRAEVLLFNQCFGNQKQLIQQFNEVRKLNPRLSKPVLHITLSLAPGERLSKDKLRCLASPQNCPCHSLKKHYLRISSLPYCPTIASYQVSNRKQFSHIELT